MSYCIAKPSAALSKFVKHYWAIESCISADKEHIQRIVPNGLLELIFYLEDRPETTAINKTISENTIVTGQIDEFYDIRVTGKLSLFSILFQPYGLSMFFNIPSNEFFNQTVPLKFILKDSVNQLEDKLIKESTFVGRVGLAEQFLLKRLQEVKEKYQYNRITESIKLINQTKGLISIEKLASAACFSRKQFERNFTELIGTSPKKFLKVVRFQNAINEKMKDINSNLTNLAYQCGFYDQSHMTNDFLKLSGMTPKQYFSECEPYSDYFQ